MTRSGVLIIRPWLSEREDFMGSPKNFSGEKPTQIGYHQGLFDLMLWECDFCWRHMLRALPFLVFRKSCPVQLCFQVIILLHRKEGEVVFLSSGTPSSAVAASTSFLVAPRSISFNLFSLPSWALSRSLSFFCLIWFWHLSLPFPMTKSRYKHPGLTMPLFILNVTRSSLPVSGL